MIETYGCIGEHLRHSFSKEIHEKIGTYDYRLQELTPDEVGPFLNAGKFLGINVTIPYKQTVMPFLDYIDPDAREIGAVNTIVNRNGRLYGYNTDFGGMKALLQTEGIELRGRTVAVLGTGGTSRTACHVAKALGASKVFRVSRTAREGAMTYEELYRNRGSVQIILNTTPAGMFPEIWDCPVDMGLFPELEGVMDAIYNPLRSVLVQTAQKRGLPATGGLYMLVAQAVLASGLFFDKSYPDELQEEIFRAVLDEKQNVVLIGMPGSGKSTIGKRLAADLGFEFLDTDEEIVRTAGKSIPEIFENEGEAGFRALETGVIRSVAPRQRLVIATGGGAVLREENVDALKMNGRTVFLDRPLEQLVPTQDRPLTRTERDMREKFEQRYPVYLAAADLRVDGGGTVEQVTKSIEDIL